MNYHFITAIMVCGKDYKSCQLGHQGFGISRNYMGWKNVISKLHCLGQNDAPLHPLLEMKTIAY